MFSITAFLQPWMSPTTETLFITEKSTFIIAACRSVRHMTDSTMHSLCWLQVFSDVWLLLTGFFAEHIAGMHCVCGCRFLLAVMHWRYRRGLNWQNKENIAILLYDSWLKLTTWVQAISNYAYLPSLLLIKQVGAKSHTVKLLCWHKWAINYHLYLCLLLIHGTHSF